MIEKESQALSERIKSIFEEQLRLCGTRTIKRALSRLGYQVSRRRIGDLMKRADLRGQSKKKFKATADSKHNLPAGPNWWNRKFKVTEINELPGWRDNLYPSREGLA